jgi:hypothetical protein
MQLYCRAPSRLQSRSFCSGAVQHAADHTRADRASEIGIELVREQFHSAESMRL